MFDDSGIGSRDSGISEEGISRIDDMVMCVKDNSDLVKNSSSKSDKVLSSRNGLGGEGVAEQEN
ncbi:hypothetical protein MA16_Dca004567 [Dendrobium catenatum]|uniref:Uncharacterized protein n=1 Tax=Dendrobium catenatum TaxID=906689 RepID=A0A2I0VNH0_9ASPA|nr:hypothetical protein MA16_Dca004567 [Dendrobium catenatum]